MTQKRIRWILFYQHPKSSGRSAAFADYGTRAEARAARRDALVLYPYKALRLYRMEGATLTEVR